MIDSLWFYVLAVPALLIVGISKGGFGGGLGILGVPMLSLAVPPPQAAAIMLPVLIVMDGFGVWRYRHHADWSNLKILLPSALLGIGIGWLSFRHLDPDAIKILIGAIGVAFVVNHWFGLVRRWSGDGHEPAGVPPQWGIGSILGTIAGFVSMVAHAGGPPLNIFLLRQRLDKRLFAGTTIVFFAVVNLVKVVPYAALGQLNGDNLWTSLALSPLAPIGIGLGFWLHARMSQGVFYRVCFAMLFVTGAKLCYDGVLGILA